MPQRFSELKYLEQFLLLISNLYKSKWKRSDEDQEKHQAFQVKMDFNQRLHEIFTELAEVAEVPESIKTDEYPKI